MSKRSIEYWNNEMVNYINKTSNHLFTKKDPNGKISKIEFIKILPFSKNNKNYYAVVDFHYKQIRVRELDAIDGDSLNQMKGYLFEKQSYTKNVSVKHFKTIKETIEKIKTLINKGEINEEYKYSLSLDSNSKKLIIKELEEFNKKSLEKTCINE